MALQLNIMAKTLSGRPGIVQFPKLSFGIVSAVEAASLMRVILSSSLSVQSVIVALIVELSFPKENDLAVSNVKRHSIVAAIVRCLIGRPDTNRIASKS